MRFSVKVPFGRLEILIEDEAIDHKDFIRKMDFYGSLPETGPNGEKDLTFVHRTAKKGSTVCNFFEIWSRTAGLKIECGQHSGPENSLYLKRNQGHNGWLKIGTKEFSDDDHEQSSDNGHGSETTYTHDGHANTGGQSSIPSPPPAPPVLPEASTTEEQKLNQSVMNALIVFNVTNEAQEQQLIFNVLNVRKLAKDLNTEQKTAFVVELRRRRSQQQGKQKQSQSV